MNDLLHGLHCAYYMYVLSESEVVLYIKNIYGLLLYFSSFFVKPKMS